MALIVSKQGPSEADATSARLEALRAELQGLKLSVLRKRAMTEGADEAEMEAVDDSDDQKEALVALIVSKDASPRPAAAKAKQTKEEDRTSVLRRELEAMKPSALRKRAASSVEFDVLETADDSENPKTAMIDLIIASKDRPHHLGRKSSRNLLTMSSDSSAFTSVDGGPGATGLFVPGKHAMLSYEWGTQSLVTRVRLVLSKRGVKCWQDIDGGMGSDIYDSMAEAVSNAAVVICFMSQLYQDSTNCAFQMALRAVSICFHQGAVSSGM